MLPRLIAFLLLCAGASAATPPNVLIVLVDDAGYGDFSCHGHPFLKTPNIDRLHAESARFTDFHVAPMCTPTRGQLLTGVDALRNGAASVSAGRAVLRPEFPTLPALLAGAGYRTGIFGKWHLGDSFPHRPMDKGFQTAVWVKGWGFTSAPEFTNTLFDGRCYRGDQTTKFKGYITDFCFDEAISWMKQQQSERAPFFCYLPLHAAHAPNIVAEKYSAMFEGKKVPGFFGMLANIDENMGRLEAFLRETKLRENTIVIFMTDNGGTAGVPVYNAGLRGHKTEYYEGGHRVPCFIRWPAGGLKTGDLAVPTQIQDIMPTLLELSGRPVARTPTDGVSLAGYLKGLPEPDDRMLVVQYGATPQVPDDPKKGRSCVIWKQWRLVLGAELYDVNADRAQTRDVAAEQPEVLAKMRAHYEKWWAGIEPRLNDFVPFTLGAPQQNPVQLTSSDWQNLYTDNSKHIRDAAGGPQGGVWNVTVDREGDYEITLRRWPFDVDGALDGNITPPGKALPIKRARITIAERETEVMTQSGDQQATATLHLPAGRTQLHGWFQDADGKDLCGSFFARVVRK
jgi:arylsulfatase A-like enzyme